MLTLSRKAGESIMINDDIVITIVETRRNKVRVSISAPREYTILREEIYNRPNSESDESTV